MSVADARPTGHLPVRTCVGCRAKGDRSVLVRVVLIDGRAAVDASGSSPGRGAWLHPTEHCLSQAMKRRAIGRALRAPEADVSALAEHPVWHSS